ncbi:MAG: bifunctional histidinol-phosphatase/imidazoleglycerol-phosphate dehydratase HisB [Microscillaceae bacterium]|nr:bifunctional histidinol-phosphatase/imidazoleglycerol-phosphate dehydratase HisB [Microscillaceae bacterium]
MKRILFLDRDGTIIIEPPEDLQVDSLEKLEFYPGVILNLHHIVSNLSYELVMVTNQDGLGTPSFPEEQFWPAHHKMLKTLQGEGIQFNAIHIDRSLEHEQAPTRKPRTGMLEEYIIDPTYDLANSYVIGDRVTDMELAYNLGAKGILIRDPSNDFNLPKPAIEEVIELITTDWSEIYQFLSLGEQVLNHRERQAEVHRKTKETDIYVRLNLDGEGKAEIETGIGFFDHMLDQVAKHAQCDLWVTVKGDLHIDEHHSIEDTAICLGEAFSKALGQKRGINRYGFSLLPMDEALAQVALDFSGRPWLVWEANFKREKVGGMPTEMFFHFFKSFSDHAACNLNIKVEGVNEHHMIEAVFKSFAKAIKMAKHRDKNNPDIPSTKGIL